jgi:hypothetical protein
MCVSGVDPSGLQIAFQVKIRAKIQDRMSVESWTPRPRVRIWSSMAVTEYPLTTVKSGLKGV